MGGAAERRPRSGLRPLRFLAAALVLCTGAVGAQSLTVSPIKAQLTVTEPVAVLTLRNEDPRNPTLVQARPSAWAVVDSEDRYDATRDLAVSPSVFRLEPGQEQIVRLTLRGRADERNERLYRLFLQQLPDESEQRSRSGNVRFLFTVGIPVVVAPSANPRPAPQVTWRLERGPAGEYRLRARNDGTGHVKVASASLATPSGDAPVVSSPVYLLPGTERTWPVKPGLTIPAGTARLTVLADDGSSSVVSAAVAD